MQTPQTALSWHDRCENDGTGDRRVIRDLGSKSGTGALESTSHAGASGSS